jgi:hypothetical protein
MISIWVSFFFWQTYQFGKLTYKEEKNVLNRQEEEEGNNQTVLEPGHVEAMHRVIVGPREESPAAEYWRPVVLCRWVATTAVLPTATVRWRNRVTLGGDFVRGSCNTLRFVSFEWRRWRHQLDARGGLVVCTGRTGVRAMPGQKTETLGHLERDRGRDRRWFVALLLRRQWRPLLFATYLIVRGIILDATVVSTDNAIYILYFQWIHIISYLHYF